MAAQLQGAPYILFFMKTKIQFDPEKITGIAKRPDFHPMGFVDVGFFFGDNGQHHDFGMHNMVMFQVMQ